jgi:predicted transcriptional regulator
VIARQLMSEMKKITKQRMAVLMKTSRAQVDRLLDPDSGSATIESLQQAARVVGRALRLQLVWRADRAAVTGLATSVTGSTTIRFPQQRDQFRLLRKSIV